jgi:hypothetical protein
MMKMLTDATVEVDSAFDEIECCSTIPAIPHEGEPTAWAQAHTCLSGFLCASHTRHAIEVLMPEHRRTLASRGFLQCRLCHQRFDNLDSFARLWVL